VAVDQKNPNLTATLFMSCVSMDTVVAVQVLSQLGCIKKNALRALTVMRLLGLRIAPNDSEYLIGFKATYSRSFR
jgi:hypothetical protein